MTALWALTLANIKSYARDRAALFWTLAFPLIFIFMFGFIFQGGHGDPSLHAAWVDGGGSPAPFAGVGPPISGTGDKIRRQFRRKTKKHPSREFPGVPARLTETIYPRRYTALTPKG